MVGALPPFLFSTIKLKKMKSIKALGVHQSTSVKIPKIDRISALGISPKNKYGHFDEKNGTTYFHTFLPYGDINKLVEE